MWELTQRVPRWLIKFLFGPMVFAVFHVSCASIHLAFEIEFASDIKDMTLFNENVILINMNDLYVDNLF